MLKNYVLLIRFDSLSPNANMNAIPCNELMFTTRNPCLFYFFFKTDVAWQKY